MLSGSVNKKKWMASGQGSHCLHVACPSEIFVNFVFKQFHAFVQSADNLFHLFIGWLVSC